MMGIPNLSLEGQVAIITGGGTGIGRSIALEFAKAGADVVVASRRLSVLEEVGREVTALGKRSLAIQTDISRKTDVDNLVQSDLPPKKESSYNVSKLGQKRGDKWSEGTSLRSKSSTS